MKKRLLLIIALLIFILYGCENTSNNTVLEIQDNISSKTSNDNNEPSKVNDEDITEVEVNDQYISINVDVLNVRESAGITFQKIGEVYLDDVFRVINTATDEDEKTWYKIQLDIGTTGWIASWFSSESTSKLFDDLSENVKVEYFKDAVYSDDELLHKNTNNISGGRNVMYDNKLIKSGSNIYVYSYPELKEEMRISYSDGLYLNRYGEELIFVVNDDFGNTGIIAKIGINDNEIFNHLQREDYKIHPNVIAEYGQVDDMILIKDYLIFLAWSNNKSQLMRIDLTTNHEVELFSEIEENIVGYQFLNDGIYLQVKGIDEHDLVFFSFENSKFHEIAKIPKGNKFIKYKNQLIVYGVDFYTINEDGLTSDVFEEQIDQLIIVDDSVIYTIVTKINDNGYFDLETYIYDLKKQSRVKLNYIYNNIQSVDGRINARRMPDRGENTYDDNNVWEFVDLKVEDLE